MKKSQGLSLRTIVIAVIAIIVMLILISIFSNKINFFSENAIDCVSKGGRCSNNCASNEITILRTSCNFDLEEENDFCCILGDQVIT